MDASYVILVVVACFATAFAGPITTYESDKCSTQCPEFSQMNYNPGTTYVYDYKVDTDSRFAGASQDSAKTSIQSTVNIEVLSPCEFALALTNTRLSHSDASGSLKTAARENEFRSEVENKPLRFSFQDGVVDHVCAELGESVQSLNFKKGILSAFQNSMDDLSQSQNVTETDVSGTCKTEYTAVSNGYYTKEVKKVKDILSCTDRVYYNTNVLMTPYNVPSDIQSLPIVKSTHECEQALENGGVLKSSICKESHVYRPFANGQNGARTTSTQTLTFQTYRFGDTVRSGDVKSRSSLLFDHFANQPDRKQSRVAVEQKLTAICDNTGSDVRPDTARLFSDLVAAMKGLDKQDLSNLHQLLKTKTICPSNGRTYKYFHDALPVLYTRASVSVMADLINSRDVTGMERTAWLTSLAFGHHVTSDMIADVKSLIDNKEVRMDAMLPVSSMINNFCKQTPTCQQDRHVIGVISSLERNIDSYCDASGDKFELTLLTLKALGNAGHSTRAVSTLNKCLSYSSNPLDIRVAAADAFRRMPCSADDTTLWDTLNDKDIDSELRIAAYQSLVRCPTQEFAVRLTELFENNNDPQVNAYIYSHATNLKETSDPHKQEAARAINNVVLDKEFDQSPLKVSRNFEVSALLNKINTGVTAEGNLVWSNKVQLPRAMSANLTVQLFGQSINLLDFGGRLEGLEHLIKNIFGPYVNSNEKIPKMNADSVKGSVYGRVFGNEMLFLHSHTSKSPLGGKTPTYLDLLIKLANKQHVALTQSVQFMDASMVIPTSAGLALNVKARGVATIDVMISGKMDLRKVGSSPRSMDVDGEIRPSAALEITGSMLLDSIVTETGLRMRNTMHTSTGVKGRIQMNRGQQLNVELDTPEEKMEIFDASSKFFIVHDDMDQEQDMIKENRKTFKVCSGQQTTQMVGMEVCGELSFPNASLQADSPYFPLTGPSSVSVTLFKRDSHSGYKLLAKRVENKKASIAQILLNTPGSKVNRLISVDMSLNYKKQNVEMNMATPWKKLAVNGNLKNDKDLKSLSGLVVIDDKDTFAMTGEVKISQSKHKLHLTPMLEFRRPGADNVQVTGSIAMEKPMKEVNLEMSLSGISKLPYSVKSSLTNTRREKSIKVSVSPDGKKEYSLEASNKLSMSGKKSVMASMKTLLNVQSPERKLVSFSSSGDYRQDKSLKLSSSVYMYRVLRKQANLKVTLLKTSRRKAVNYQANVNLKSSALSGKVVCNLAKKPRGMSSLTSKIDYTIPKVSKNTISFSGKFNDKSTKAYTSYTVQSNVLVKKNPEYNSNIKLDVGHKKKLSFVSADVKYGSNSKDATKRVYLLTSVNKKIVSMKNALVNYKVKALAPAYNIDVFVQGKHQHTPKLLDSNVQLTYAPKKNISAAVTLKNRSTKLTNMIGKTSVSWPGQEYTINTELTQKAGKQYDHVLNFESSSGTKHTMSTVYKMPRSDSHAVVTEFKLHQMKPVTISGSTNLNRRNFAASGELKLWKDVYGFNTISKFTKAPNARMSLELIHPLRRVTLDVNGGKTSRGKYEGKVEAAWDADKDENQRMILEGGYFQKSATGSVSLGGNVNFRSPFEKFENIVGNVKYGSDSSQHSANGKFLWGDKSNQVVSTMTVKKPISLRNFDLKGNIKTPFKGFRNAEIDVTHKMDSELRTVIGGSIEKEKAKLSIEGQTLSKGFKGNMNLKSTIKNAENVDVTISHTGNNGKYNSQAELNHNGKVYSYDLVMFHSGDGLQRTTAGDLVLTMNKKKVATHWDHRNTDSLVKSTLSTKWNNKQLLVELDGSHKLADLRNINGALKIKSPWKPVRDIELNLDHKHGTGLINSIAFMKQGSNKKASSVINYNRGQNNADFDFNIASPFHEDLIGKLSTNYDSYPMTTSAELTWAPRSKGTLEGSIDLDSWNNLDLNLKITTPSRTLRNVVLKASNKKQNGQTISHLNLDYGMRQNIDVEFRFFNEAQSKIIRLKLRSPFEKISSLETGLNFNGNAYNFDTTADFELLPTVGKFDGSINWKYDDELNGKIRVDTPFIDYPYFELSTSSKLNGGSRKSHLQAEYSPRQVYSLDTAYRFGTPLSLDAVIKSPFPEYDDIGMSVNHNMGDNSVKSHGEVTYQSDKKIEADFNADWASDVEGSLVVKTPFLGYESNKALVRHRGDLEKFDSHGEINVAEQNVVADASFKSGYTTTGTFTFSSPIPGLESIDVSLKKRGNKKNFKAGATVNVNGDKFQTTLNNKLTNDSLKTNFNLMTPYTEALKLGLDHSGPLDGFTNKININYGRKVDIDTITAFTLREMDVNGNSILKYKLGNKRNTASVSFNKNGLVEDVSFSTTATFNKEDISISGSLRTKDHIDGSIQVKTPFKHFKNTGMTISHSGDMTDFTSNANVNYMDNKNINGKVQFSNKNGIKLSSELTTPFKKFESTSFNLNHDINDYSQDISGTAELTTTIGDFGTGDVFYRKTGDIDDLVLKGSVSYNGKKDIAVAKMTNKMGDSEAHSMLSWKSVATPEVYFSIDHSGDKFSFQTKTKGKFGENAVSTVANMKRSYDSISADSSITYLLNGQPENEASISLNKEGPLDNCNMELTGKLDNDETKLSVSRAGPLNDMRFSGSASYNTKSITVSGKWKNTDSIDGNLRVTTPFANFNKVGMALSHSGDVSDFSTIFNIEYMDGKSVNGKVGLTAYTLNNIKFISELTTPFENFETLNMKFNNIYNAYTSELNGDAAIDTSVAGYGTSSLVYSKTGGLDNLEVTGNVLKKGVKVAELKITNSLQDEELHSSFELKSSLTHRLMLTVDHNGDLTNLKTSARASYGKKNIITGEGSLNQRSSTIDAEGKFMYTIKKFGSNQLSLNVHKEGHMNNFNVEITGKNGAKTSKITGNFKSEDELTGDLTVTTPIEGYKNVGLSFKHSGSLDRFNSQAKIVVTDSEEYSGKIDFYRQRFQTIEAVVELNTPITDYEFTKFEYRHVGEPDSLTCSSSLQYGDFQRMTYDLTAKSSPKPEMTVTLKMPQDQYVASGSYENNWPRFAVNGKLEAGEGRSISLDSSLDASRDVVGVLTLSTTVEDFNNVGFNFHYTPRANGMNTEGSITYMDGKEIAGKFDATLKKGYIEQSVEIITPFAGREFTRYEMKHVSNKKVVKSTTKLIYGDNKRIVVDGYFKFKPTPESSITITSPFSQDIEAFVSLDNAWPKYELTCKMSPGNGDRFTLDGTFDATKDISGSLKIGTPFDNFNNIGMNFMHSGDRTKFGTEGTLTYMDGKEVFGKVNFFRYMWRRLDGSLELTTPFAGMETTKAEVNFEDNSNSISTAAALEYNNGDKLNGNVKITYSPTYEVLVTLNTPFSRFNVVKAQGALDFSAPNYEALCIMNYGPEQIYSANGKLNYYSAENLDGSLEVSTPLSGFEYTKAEYQHKFDSSELDGSISLTYDDGKKMSCDLKSTYAPNFDGSVTVTTPFTGFENLRGSATFDTSYKKYETSSSFNLGQGKVYSMTSELDYSIEPMKASTKISTPFRDFRKIELDLTHEGDLNNFKTTGFLSSPLTDHVNAKASLRYDALMDMSAAASLQSSLEGFDDLKAEVKISDVVGEVKTSGLLGWTSGQQMTYDSTFRKQEGWNEDKLHADVSISTPFVAVRSINLNMDHSAGSDSYGEKMTFELNGDSLLDFDAEYSSNDKQVAEIVVRQPWPMQYTVSKASGDGTTDVEIFGDWNRDEQDSNVRLQASVTSKSDNYQMENGLDLSMTYASRKVGVVHKLSHQSSQLSGNGYVYWGSDDDSKISYDLQVNENSRRRKQMVDGSLKLGLPTRTLGLTGSYSESPKLVSTDAAFSWDADRDESKQIGVQTNLRLGDNLKGDVTLRLPSMMKEFRVDGEVTLGQGRIILDTKTDISYSRDSRKTITLTSKLEDISDKYSHFNYSLALGLKQAYTHVDIGVNSHIGSSDEMLTLGMATNYLTSKRQMKNLALLSEIDLLKKQMSVQVFNPETKIEVVGDVVSETPYTLRLLNRIDDQEIFRSDLTIDSVKKSVVVNAFSDSDSLTLAAKYPNNSAFRVDFTRHTPEFDQQEALLAVGLNTSRLLHTHLSWRPDMMQEFKDYAWPRLLKKTESALTGIASLNEEISDELSDKYSAITNEINQELQPFIAALDEELALVADKMKELSEGLAMMYANNDFYIQKLGYSIVKLQQKLERLTEECTTIYTHVISSMRETLNEMRRFHIGAHYKHFVTQTAGSLVAESVRYLASLELYMAELDYALQEYKSQIGAIKHNAVDTIYKGGYVDYLSNQLGDVESLGISPYISSFDVPEPYTNVVYQIPSKFHAKLNDVLDRYDAKYLKDGINEVYQQGAWAYNYWEVEENLEKHARSILNSLKGIVEEELKQYADELAAVLRNPVTVWEPEHGEIMADIPLPISVKRLDKLPDVTPYVNKVENFADSYLPDRGTWNNLVESVSDMWPSTTNETSDNNLVVQIDQMKPHRKFRKGGRGRRYRVKKNRRQ